MIKIAIVDDEKKERDNIENMLLDISKEKNFLYQTSCFENGKQFLFDFQYGLFDLILLDIELYAEQNGMEVANQIRKIDQNVTIIFITNLAQYAIEGYRVQAFDYIVKPIKYLDFKTRIETVVDMLEKKMTEKVLIQTNGTKIVLLIKDIYYIEVSSHQLIYHTSKGIYKTYGALKDIVLELKEYHFSLCNSCFLVNLEYVEKIEGYELTVKGEKIFISHPKKKKFLDDLNIYLGI